MKRWSHGNGMVLPGYASYDGFWFVKLGLWLGGRRCHKVHPCPLRPATKVPYGRDTPAPPPVLLSAMSAKLLRTSVCSSISPLLDLCSI
jgi:hypothetical protein